MTRPAMASEMTTAIIATFMAHLLSRRRTMAAALPCFWQLPSRVVDRMAMRCRRCRSRPAARPTSARDDERRPRRTHRELGPPGPAMPRLDLRDQIAAVAE